MAKQSWQQLKLLRLQQILLEETDEHHGLSMEALVARLEAFGIAAERKSVYNNLELLNQFGMDIIKERRGSSTLYYVASRTFETAELRLLADAVASSRFITQKKSGQLIEKLETLTSRHLGADFKRQVLVASRIKNMNETIFYLVDDLNRAIGLGRVVQFHYYDWVVREGSLRRIARHGGALYTVSPWQLLWQDEFYYLIAYDHRAQEIRHYRVDRMGEIHSLEEKRQGEKAFSSLRMEGYMARLFGMFGGESRFVALSFPMRLLEVMIDQFGKQITPRALPDGLLRIRVELIPSLPFFGWLLSLGDEVRLLEPEDLVLQYQQVLKTALNRAEAKNEIHAEGEKKWSNI